VVFPFATNPQGLEVTMTVPAQPETAWQGINHVALVTPDLAATIHFYRDLLGLRLAALLPATEEHGRHALDGREREQHGPGLAFL
jgi:Glyoxalase/Bleomycin resistance protein/Dioxygenase superfamily